MATDPLRGAGHETFDIPLTFGVREALVRLADPPPSLQAPYVTASLDWTPSGENPGREPTPEMRRSQARGSHRDAGEQRRPARHGMERELDRLLDAHGPRGAAFDNLKAAAERIASYIDDELDPSAQGVYIVANPERQVFEALALGLPIHTRIHAGPTPMLSPLARMVDDHPGYMVLLADQHEATLSLVRRARRGKRVWLDSSEYPRRTQQGGPSQRRYQARVDERISAFARKIAEETLHALRDADVDMLVVAGDEVITSELKAEFHETVTDRIVDWIRLDIKSSEQEILDATLPIVAEAERERELAKVQQIAGAVGADERGASGGAAVLRAVQAGQVSVLAMVDDYTEQGWADYRRDVFGVGPIPSSHPLDGEADELVPIALEEELIRRAVQTNADIEIVKTDVSSEDWDDVGIPQTGSTLPRTEAAMQLDGLGGVGALLRYD